MLIPTSAKFGKIRKELERTGKNWKELERIGKVKNAVLGKIKRHDVFTHYRSGLYSHWAGIPMFRKSSFETVAFVCLV